MREHISEYVWNNLTSPSGRLASRSLHVLYILFQNVSYVKPPEAMDDKNRDVIPDSELADGMAA